MGIFIAPSRVLGRAIEPGLRVGLKSLSGIVAADIETLARNCNRMVGPYVFLLFAPLYMRLIYFLFLNNFEAIE